MTAPQTFEEWHKQLRPAARLFGETEMAREAFAAGVASQQAEIERLKALNRHDAQIKLARYEAVVEAALEVAIHHAAGVLSGSLNASLASPMKKLRAALAALESDGK